MERIKVRKPKRYGISPDTCDQRPLPFDPIYWDEASEVSSEAVEMMKNRMYKTPKSFEVKVFSTPRMPDYRANIWNDLLKVRLDFMAEIDLEFKVSERYWYELGRI